MAVAVELEAAVVLAELAVDLGTSALVVRGTATVPPPKPVSGGR